MKKILSLLLAAILLCTTFSVPASAADNKLNAREKAIANAYIKAYEKNDKSEVSKYIPAGFKYPVENGFKNKKVKMFGTVMTKGYDPINEKDYIHITGTVAVSTKKEIKLYKANIKLLLYDYEEKTYLYYSSGAETREVSSNSLSKYTYNKVKDYLTKTYNKTTAQKLLDSVKGSDNQTPKFKSCEGKENVTITRAADYEPKQTVSDKTKPSSTTTTTEGGLTFHITVLNTQIHEWYHITYGQMPDHEIHEDIEFICSQCHNSFDDQYIVCPNCHSEMTIEEIETPHEPIVQSFTEYYECAFCGTISGKKTITAYK